MEKRTSSLRQTDTMLWVQNPVSAHRRVARWPRQRTRPTVSRKVGGAAGCWQRLPQPGHQHARFRRPRPAAGDSPACRYSRGGKAPSWPGRRSPDANRGHGEWCRRVRPRPARPGPTTRGSPGPVGDMAPPEAAQEGRQDGAFCAAQGAGSPAGNTSAVDAVATIPDATRVIILSPVLARPGALPRSRRCRTSSGRPRRRAGWPAGSARLATRRSRRRHGSAG